VRLLRELRRERFDAVYDFEFFTRFSALSRWRRRAARHGFASAERVARRLPHRHAPFNRYWHVARNFRVLAGGENGRNVTAHDVAPHALRRARRRARRRAARSAPASRGERFVVLNPNAGELSLERRWPRENFAVLARSARARGRRPVVLIGSAGEREYTAIAERIGAPRAQPRRRADDAELVALFARAAVVVTNDSGPMHLAAAIGAPTLGLFGPETPGDVRPARAARARSLPPAACSPCINVHDNKLSSCIYGEPQCLVAISVDEVLEDARALARRGFRARPRAVARAAPRTSSFAQRPEVPEAPDRATRGH
jgi:ADP-heptose:LPS heptosyltransferase